METSLGWRKQTDIEIILIRLIPKEIIDRDVRFHTPWKISGELFYEPAPDPHFLGTGGQISKRHHHFASSGSTKRGNTKGHRQNFGNDGVDAGYPHSSSGAANYLCNHINASIINAGDGTTNTPSGFIGHAYRKGKKGHIIRS